MKAVSARNGRIFVTEMEEPELEPGHVLIRTEYSAISPGTEMSMVLGSGDRTVVLGYSAVGIVERTGEGVVGLEPGSRVACYGAPYVRHAERLAVPSNLTAKVPDHVDPREAACSGLGAIAIHALRTAGLQFGESVVVVGLGILGNLIAQIANAAAYRTAGVDLKKDRAARLRELGVPCVYTDPAVLERDLADITGGAGADAVLLCASGSGETLINRALEWIRDRGKIVIVGDLTLSFSRAVMFAKEAQLLISRAGGPGRYDAGYERENRDYPIGYVRWTEGRNVAEFVRLLAEKRIRVAPLITHEVPFERAPEVYELYRRESSGVIGALLCYGDGA
ncbi:MAG: alcohol dehydrogenase [Thermobacillus sp. ZCTH02-B1]|mgnify:FL=1|uniref:zinc-dependent alcohol dehydrogenase n=1 Tax=Thermobacillus sp. ZCTH02-B1 TaxID=1858795 RepID=UPI000B571F63|nr:zinc-binding alcohol dehydrogenase [Thermobacillus sp. ZCTH02-B1]OUM93813.1 MAG: alcohol dehydrogenase [Thermobacillus sp. ZCTH02-B1]